MSFLEPYTIRVSVFVCKFALPILTELDVKYIEKHSLKAQLDLHKTSVFEDFTDLVNKKKTVSMATTRLCDRIRPHICEHIRQDLLQKIRIYTLEKCPSKEYLIVKIMTELAQNNQFAPYMAYIHDPYSYALEWLEQFGNDLCFEEPRDFYYHNAKVKMESLLSEIKVVVRSNEEKGIRHCLSNIDEKLGFIKPFLDHYLKQLGDETDLDTSDFKTTFLEEIDQMYDKLKKEFRAVNKATIRWPLETPYKSVLDHIWGCNSDCPFCLEPCILGRDHEKMVAHRCIQHRPTGLKKWFWEDSDKLSIENCNVEVGARLSLYKCGHICTRGPPERHTIGFIRNIFVRLGIEKFHAYKDYKKFFPDWDIVPHSDMSSSVYWAWVLCQFNAQFAAYYEKEEADIPASWTLYTKEDAIDSLPILDNS
ncbi:Interferon-induced very large GTPase 1 [Mizuhopecten yessoensis]|uniref:Interferon-induced very large GTPase 1 n=1 Tax=Mizuhopecten yessoensis TaxID=6573 RepID=A0A210QUR9_MIZYE|nr:Interferon-induced very large GTPase 1 [Mizuhopecten yessoensis]